MSSKKLDYSIFDKFKFERKPVGVKYSMEKPEGIKPTKKNLALCELFKEAQTQPAVLRQKCSVRRAGIGYHGVSAANVQRAARPFVCHV